MQVNDRVTIPAMLPDRMRGTIAKIRHDDRGEAILTIALDDPALTPDGVFYARPWEVAPDFTDFQWRMFDLDAALTGKDARHVAQTTRQKRWTTVLEWLDHYDIWYLSDGGYSRIGFSWESRDLFLCSESRAEVKAAWERCAKLMADAEAEIRKALAEEGI